MATAHTRGRPNARLGHLKNLLAGPHGPGSPIFEELAKQTVDYIYWKEDFLGLTAAEGIGASKVFQYTESGASFVDPAKTTATAALQSHITLASGATDNVNANIVGPACFAAKHNPFFEVRFQVDTALAVDTYEFAFGFATAIPASSAAILGDIDTPTFAAGVTDAAVIAMDGDETLKTAAFQTIGANATVGKTTIAPVTTPFGFPLLNTDITYRVELRSPTPDDSVSRCFAYINGQLVAERNGPDAEVLLTPVLQLGVRSTTEVIWKVDYFALGGEKAGAPFN